MADGKPTWSVCRFGFNFSKPFVYFTPFCFFLSAAVAGKLPSLLGLRLVFFFIQLTGSVLYFYFRTILHHIRVSDSLSGLITFPSRFSTIFLLLLLLLRNGFAVFDSVLRSLLGSDSICLFLFMGKICGKFLRVIQMFQNVNLPVRNTP